MSIIRNRELSQFGSFIYIDNDSKDIGIATESTPYVGIGTANPTVKFHVVGNTNLEGNVNVTNGSINASSYNINGNPLVDVTILQWIYASNGTDMYYLPGNIGIGTSDISQKLTVNGNVSAGQFISTVTSGTAPFQVLSDTVVANLNAARLNGKSAPDGDIVGTSDAQTLANKTLTSPIISAISNSGTLTLPTGTGTLIRTGSVGLVTSGMIADSSIVNVDVAANAGITYGKLSLTNSIVNADIASGASIAITKLASSTISGVSLGGTLNNLSFGSHLTASGPYNGSSAISVSVAGTSVNNPNTIVIRDSLGNFTGGRITATDFNSTSDVNLKTNIQTVDNALETVNSLRGVSFDWKETGNSSYGVIAQELEEILPQLVNDGDHKSVNYNGLIVILIEAVKELSQEVEYLRKKVSN
jgi:hypothetical protein